MIPSMTIVKTAATKKECVARTITTEYHIRASADSIAKNSRTIGVLLEDLRYFNRMMTKYNGPHVKTSNEELMVNNRS